MNNKVLPAILLSTSLFLSTTPAAIITWGTATDIAGDSDVSTKGTLVGAFNLGSAGVAATTVNGVTFNAFAVPPSSSVTLGNYTLASPGILGLGANNSFGSGSTPFSALTADYRALLGTAAGPFPGSNAILTMSGLTVGDTYEFQWWSNFSAGPLSPRLVTATAGNSVTLSWNTTNLAGGVGQFSLGSFIADNASQQITFSQPGDLSIVNGFQLRQTGAAGVPDYGATVAMFGLVLAGLAGVRRWFRV